MNHNHWTVELPYFDTDSEFDNYIVDRIVKMSGAKDPMGGVAGTGAAGALSKPVPAEELKAFLTAARDANGVGTGVGKDKYRELVANVKKVATKYGFSGSDAELQTSLVWYFASHGVSGNANWVAMASSYPIIVGGAKIPPHELVSAATSRGTGMTLRQFCRQWIGPLATQIATEYPDLIAEALQDRCARLGGAPVSAVLDFMDTSQMDPVAVQEKSHVKYQILTSDTAALTAQEVNQHRVAETTVRSSQAGHGTASRGAATPAGGDFL